MEIITFKKVDKIGKLKKTTTTVVFLWNDVVRRSIDQRDQCSYQFSRLINRYKMTVLKHLIPIFIDAHVH